MAMILRDILMNTRAVARQNGRQLICECGALIPGFARFCPQCGSSTHAIQPRIVAGESRAVIRRVLAEIVDRVIPVPFVAYFFPPWILIVVLFHLISDGSPSGRSPGKWMFRLRVVSVTSNSPCGVWRSILRRLPTALGQAAYCSWVLVPLVLAYELASLAFVWLNPAGRRFEDYFAGTQVISESQYQRLHPICLTCGLRVSTAANFCANCGTGSA